MGKKGGMPVYKTVDDYIAAQKTEAQSVLKELRALIKEAVPECMEIANSKVPSFILVPGRKPEQQLMIAAYAKFVSFYPHQAAIDHFETELEPFETGKGTVKLPFNSPLPKDLIIRMVQFRRDEILNKA